MTAAFVPGLELARLYYGQQVRPLLDESFPGLAHSAALIGPGSEVLGFDTARSADHDWGPRLQLFLREPGLAADVGELLAARLPAQFRDYPTVFAASGAAEETATHWVEVAGLSEWLTGMLGFDPLAGVGLLDWLATPTQLLAEVTGGAVFHDGLAVRGAAGAGEAGVAGGQADRHCDGRLAGPADGRIDGRADGRIAGRADRLADDRTYGLAAARAALDWYPHDVWLYVLACQWQRIDQEEPFPGRCAEVGDDLGSAFVASRLTRDLIRLVLLMQRRYPPYSKWLGTAFTRTQAGAALLPVLAGALTARSWPDREDYLCAAYEAAARMHNELGLTAYVDPSVRPTFYDRPYRVLGAGRFVRALRDAIADERIRELPLAGAIDQFTDSTDAIADHRLRRTAIATQLG